MTRQLPLLFCALCINSLALSWTHLGVAPDWLVWSVPTLVVPACFVRAIVWYRMPVDRLDDARVTYVLRRTIVFVALLGVVFTAWSLRLFDYGDVYSQLHVLFFMSITVVGCIFCLVHLRPAALALTGIVVVPILARLLPLGNAVLTAIAINLLIVTAVMILMMLAYYEDFRRQVLIRQEVERLGEQHQRAAQTDALTGLANRRRFFRDLRASIEAGGDAVFAVGLVDLDGFKPVNDVHGHAAGDRVLQAIGRRLEAALPSDGLVARLGGDEFGLIVRGPRLADLERFGAEICALIAEPMTLRNGGRTQVGASIGFAVFPGMGRSQETLLERADFALYHAKEQNRGTAVVFTDAHASEIRERRRIERALLRADLEAEMTVVFQPIVDVGGDRVAAFEALARWTSPELGWVGPGDFVPAAERTGIVRDLTAVLFRKACRAAATWPSDVKLSFNLSANDLFGDDPVERLAAPIRDAGLPFARVILEITETAFMRDFAGGSATLQALRDLGCRVALDDFGTGYSSLSYVHRLPLDKLKIDQSFVRSLTEDRTSRAIVRSIYHLSATLGVQCVVEGVETPEQFVLLRAMGCAWMQGNLFSRPLNEASALVYLGTGAVTATIATLPPARRPRRAAA